MSAHAQGVNPFADTEDQAALRRLARDVADRELAPMARHGDETEEFPQWAWDAFRKSELFGVTIGERWGGAGLGDVEAAIVLESPGVTIAGTHVKMGLRATSEAELAFDDVRVEPDDVLLWGDASNSDAFKTLISHINHERCGNAAMCVGAAQGALEYAVQYMNERVVGGRPLPSSRGPRGRPPVLASSSIVPGCLPRRRRPPPVRTG